MKDPHKPFRVLAAFRRLKSLSRDNYEGSTQAGSSRHGRKPVVSWLHLRGSNPYHGTIMKDPHKEARVLAAFKGSNPYHGTIMKDPDKLVSWLHLGGANPYHGTIKKGPHKLDPRAMERSLSCLGCI